MEQRPLGVKRGESNYFSLVDKGWNIISLNAALMIFIVIGFVELLIEAVGYNPFMRLDDLLPPFHVPANITTMTHDTISGNNTDYADYKIVHQLSHWVETVGSYTVHINLAALLLMPYTVITERQKGLLVPWLVMNFVTVVVRKLLVALIAIVVCATFDVFRYPCLQYSAQQGALLWFDFYFWMSVHGFFYFLKKKTLPQERVANVIDTIKRNGSTTALVQSTVDVLTAQMEEADDDVTTEAMLVERAAMAWIAREILENDGEYVTDRQFSQYLVVKATMELRQALMELAEKKRKKARRNLTPKQKIAESLEFMKLTSKRDSDPAKLSKTEAFDSSNVLSKRDPIRLIRPLTSYGKPVSSDMSLVTGISVFSDITVSSGSSAESGTQTEPPTHHISQLLDLLEFQQNQRRRKLELERQDSMQP